MTFEFDALVSDRGLEVSFALSTGETVALLGQNGAGKSTVLAIAAGLLTPDSGSVVLSGRTLTSIGDTPRIDVPPHRREIALLAQDPLLFPHLDVRENVAFGPRSSGRSRASARAAADRWLAEVGASDLATRSATGLSGGQAQRVALARALAAEPQLLLLDEPMAALDVAVTPALRQTLRRVLTDRTTLIVTHDPLDALLLADRVVVLDQGRVVESGPTRDVLAHPRSTFAAQLAGLNLLTGTWAGDRVALPDGRAVVGQIVGLPPGTGDAAIATFRPSAVAIYRDARSGSPRNGFDVRVDGLEPMGDLVRVRAGQLSADVTAQAVADLDLVPGLDVTFTVKATEVSVYPT